jgi:hypothetical protein
MNSQLDERKLKENINYTQLLPSSIQYLSLLRCLLSRKLRLAILVRRHCFQPARAPGASDVSVTALTTTRWGGGEGGKGPGPLWGTAIAASQEEMKRGAFLYIAAHRRSILFVTDT